MADGSRNNPADVHRTSRTSLQFHCNPLGTTFHIQYRSIQTKVSTVSHTTTQELLKKSPRGVQRGAALCHFAVFSHSNVIYPLRGRSLCAIQPEAAAYAAYTAGVPQSMRYIRRGLRNLYYATIYPTEIYKVPFDTFRLSVELPIQKHTGTS